MSVLTVSFLQVFVYCDFHGHSRKSNVFMYGNSTTEMNGNKIANVKDFLGERMLPFLISKLVSEVLHSNK